MHSRVAGEAGAVTAYDVPGAGTTGPADQAGHRPAAAGRRLHVPAVDGFRGYAALAVLLFHVIYAAGRPRLDEGLVRSVLVSGYMGVDFFFVISGFVLFLPAATNGGHLGDLRAYATRRAARILPGYYLVLVGVVALHPLITNAATYLPQNSLKGVFSFVLHLTFLEHTVGLALGLPEGFAIHGAVWTLSLEALFYVLLPLVATWYFRRPLAGLGIAVLGAALWKFLATSPSVPVPTLGGGSTNLRLILVTQLPTYLAHFAAGMTAAWLFVRLRSVDRARLAPLAVPAQVVAIAVIIAGMRAAGIRDLRRTGGLYTDAAGRWHYDHWTHTTVVALAFAVLLLATVLAPRWARWPFANPVARWLGDVSYGVYLWHLVVIGFALKTLHFAPAGTTWAFVRMLAVTLAGSFLAAWASFVLVERPFIRWARRRSADRRDGLAAVERASLVLRSPPAG